MARTRTAARLMGLLAALVLAGVCAPAAHGADFVIAASGDQVCGRDTAGPPVTTSSGCRQNQTADVLERIATTQLDAVLPLGDVQYECGELVNFRDYYTPSWGRPALLALTRPVIGNHEYRFQDGTNECLSPPDGNEAQNGRGYFTYFGWEKASPQDPNCVAGCKGYYSYDLGNWHLVALNSNCSRVGGCSANSPQGVWLEQDLDDAVTRSNCILAYWHAPRFSSGGRQTSSVHPFWEKLFDHGADVVLTGHDHTYERFNKLGRGTSAAADPVADPAGIRQWVVGVGGRNFTSFTTIRAESIVRDRSAMGVLSMTLHDNSYDWKFEPEAGKTFTDTGNNEPCNGAPVAGNDTTAPTVTDRSPAADATGVATNTTVSATFSEPVQGVSGSTFTLSSGTTNVAATVARVGSTNQYTLTPTAPLAENTTYTATLTGGPGAIRDTATNPNPLATTSWSFATGGGGGGGTQTFVATADATIDDANRTLNAGSDVRLTADTSPVNHFLLRFNVTGCNSPTAATLTLKIGGSSTDNSTATGAGRVFGVSPTDANINWAENTVTWNTAPATVGTGITTTGSAASLNTGVTFNVLPLVTGNGALTLRVAGTSSNGVRYYAREDNSATSADPTLQVTCSGGTPSPGDTTRPSVSTRSPADGATGVAVGSNVTATFSEAVQGVDQTSFALRAGTATSGPAIDAPVSGSGTQWTLNPAADLAANTQYTVTLTGGTSGSAIRDASGNALDPNPTIWRFTTAAGGGTPTTRTATVYATADTMVEQAAATTNRGATNPLKTDAQDLTTAGSAINSYLRFDLPPLAPGETITAATLGLVVRNETSNGPAIFRTDPAWNEATMTWNAGRPARIGTAAVGNFGSMPVSTATTTIAASAFSGIAGGGQISFELAPESTNGLDYAAREDGGTATTNDPRLTLTISTPATLASSSSVFADALGSVFAFMGR